MTIDIPNEYEDLLRRAVASGRFADETSALQHALQLLARHALPANDESHNGQSPHDSFTRAGVIGSMKRGPSDLATNPSHMDGFGE